MPVPTLLPAAVSRYRDAVMALVPVGYWRLGEPAGGVAIDETYGHHGTYVGPVALSQPGLLVNDSNRAAGFVAANGTRVEIGDLGVAQGHAPYSIVALVATTPDASFARIVALVAGSDHGAGIGASNTATMHFRNGPAGPIFASAVPLAPGAHLLVATYDGTTMSMSVDGATPTTYPGGEPLPDPLATYIGDATPLWGAAYTGTIDDVAIWGRALSAFEISTLWDAARDASPAAGPWVTADAILAQAGATSPSPADQAWADDVAAAISAGFDARLYGAWGDDGLEPPAYLPAPTPLPAELTVAALNAGVELYKRREAPFGPTGYVDIQGAAIRLARDYLEAVAPILARYATVGIA